MKLNKATIESYSNRDLLSVVSNGDKSDELFVISCSNTIDVLDLWTDELRELDGVIVNSDYEVIARSFRKPIDLSTHGEEVSFVFIDDIYEYVDGDLGIMYYHRGGLKIATKRGFNSNVCKIATKLLNEKYSDFCVHMLKSKEYETRTYVFQISIPETLLETNDFNDALIPLAVVNNANCAEMYNQYTDIFRSFKSFKGISHGFGSEGNLKETIKYKLSQTANANVSGFVLSKSNEHQRYYLTRESYTKEYLIACGFSRAKLIECIAKNNDIYKLVKSFRSSKVVPSFNNEYGKILASFVKSKEDICEKYLNKTKDKTFKDKKEFYVWAQGQHLGDIYLMIYNNVPEKTINKQILRNHLI
jgi:hypothetical protein